MLRCLEKFDPIGVGPGRRGGDTAERAGALIDGIGADRAGDLAGSEAEYERALERNPQRPEALLSLAALLMLRHEASAAGQTREHVTADVLATVPVPTAR